MPLVSLEIIDGNGLPLSLAAKEVGGTYYPLHILTADPDFEAGLMRAPIDAADLGDNTLVAADPQFKIKVQGLWLVPDSSVKGKFMAGDADLTGMMNFAAGGNGFAPQSTFPGMHMLETPVNEPLILNLSAAVQVGGIILYSLEA